MKKSLIAVALVTPLASVAPVAAFARDNVPDTYGYIGAHASEYFFYDNQVNGGVNGLDNSLLPGGQIGWRFDPHWSIQGWYEKSNSVDYKYTSGSTDVEDWYGSLRYHFNNHSLLGFEPYMGLNVGRQKVTDHKETMTGVELGLQRELARYLLVDFGTRQAYGNDRHFWEGQVYLGLNLMFGVGGRKSGSSEETATTQPAAAVTADSDGDGVPDSKDACPDTPANAVVDDRGCQVYKTSHSQTVNTVNFQFDKADIQPRYQDQVKDSAAAAKGDRNSTIRVDGYTDSTGPADYNQGLSERRANSVKRDLINNYQVDGSKITTEGHGESDPAASNDTAAGRAKNRRATITVDSEKKVPEFKDR